MAFTKNEIAAASALIQPFYDAIDQLGKECKTLSDDELDRLQEQFSDLAWSDHSDQRASLASIALADLVTDRERQKLLSKYGTKDPKRFVQYDADFFEGEHQQPWTIVAGFTSELMAGSGMRVLIPRDTKVRTADTWTRRPIGPIWQSRTNWPPIALPPSTECLRSGKRPSLSM